MNKAQTIALKTAAMELCCVILNHSIECDCESCYAALEALPYLPSMDGSKYQEQFFRRLAVHKLFKQQREEKAKKNEIST